MKLLDLFCGAGGAGKGYHLAGFEVVGVDINPQPRYPFEFHEGDAMEFLSKHGHEFDAIHASPVCKKYSFATCFHPNIKDTHPDQIPGTRKLLDLIGVPYVIENVPGAPIRKDILLCGEMFGLRVHRHRYFEACGWVPSSPKHIAHKLKGAKHNCHVESGYTRIVAGNYSNHEDACEAMGIDWMNRKELSQAIPPAYTKYIGDQIMEQLSC